MAFGRLGTLGAGFGRLGASGAGGVSAVLSTPVLTTASAADFSDTFVWGRATTDVASGTLYAVVVAGAASTPTAAQIVAGTDAAGAAAPNGNVAISSTGVKNVLVRGLTAVTSYKVCMTHQNGANASNVVTGSFTTDTLVNAFITAGTVTGMNFLAGNGSSTSTPAVADPFGGTNAIRWTDINDAAAGVVNCSCTVTAFFNGVNKLHFTTKLVGGAAWLRIAPASTTVILNTHMNTSTGAVGTNAWAAATVFDLGGGWFQFSSSINMAGADLNGFLAWNKAPADNTTGVASRNGTHISDLYNIRITRV